MMKILLGVFLLITATVTLAYGQEEEAGLPFIHNFTPREYNANTQNWAAVQDWDGIMYFGNNKGVLQYDGVSWRLIPVSNNSVVRSLSIDSAGTIYVGAVGEFGYLAPDSTGTLSYYSLISLVGEHEHGFSDVWSTLVKGNEVYFHTRNFLFRYKDSEIKSWPLTNSYHRSFLVYDKVYLRQDGQGLMVLEGDSLVKLGRGDIFSKEVVSAMLPYKGKILIGSRSRGLFLHDPKLDTIYQFQTKVNRALSESFIYHGVVLPNGNFAFASIKDGVYIVDGEGRNIMRLYEGAGLQQNLTLYLYVDMHGTLWASLAKGISKIEISLPIQIFNEILDLRGGVNGVVRYNGALFVATHQGVYFLNKGSHFEKLEGLDGQGWNFIKFDVPSEPGHQKLLLASSVGVYEVEAGKVCRLLEGAAFDLTVSKTDPSRVFIGLNGSLGALRYEERQWINEGQVKIVDDAIRSIKEDDFGNIWMGSMYEGVYRLNVRCWQRYLADSVEFADPGLQTYGIADGLPTTNWNIFYQLGEKLIMASQKGIYKFNYANNRFEKESSLNKPFQGQDRWFYYLIADEKGNVWFDSEKGKGVLIKHENGYKLSKNVLKRINISQENVVGSYIDKNGIVWFGTPDGLFRYDNKQNSFQHGGFNALIRQVVLGEGSLIFNGAYSLPAHSEMPAEGTALKRPSFASTKALPYKKNSLFFHFAAPAYNLEGSNLFSYFLEGYDRQWSAWSRETKKEYTNLPEGKYTFRVKARNFYGEESEEATYTFSILPPWYRTSPAFAIYIIAFFSFVFGVTKTYSARLKKDNQRLEAVIESRMAEIRKQKEEIESQKNEVERSYQNVTALSQIGQSITANLDMESIIDILYYSISPLMDFSNLGVGIYNESTQSLDFKHTYEDGEIAPPFSFKLNEEGILSTWSFNNRKEVFINNIEDESAYYIPSYRKSPSDKYLCQSIICLPLQVKEKTLGVLTIKSLWKNAYQPYHLDILHTLAAYSAIGLDNSYAYLRLNEINEKLSATLENLKHTQMQLVQSEKMASLGQLTAGVAHEINNPINFVSAGIDSLSANYEDMSRLLEKFAELKPGHDNSSLLQELEVLKQELEVEYLLEEVPQLLNSIKSGASRTTEIVKSLKNFTRLDEENLKPANIHAGLDSTLVILRSQMGQRIEVIKSYDDLPTVYCYPGQLNQVFMNILGNAIQAIEGEGKIYIHTAMQQNEIVISLRDSGKGMSEEVQKRIFEPFFTTKEIGEGTGLGLSISYGIIEKHKGIIKVKSEPGNGTEFIIHLPVNLI